MSTTIEMSGEVYDRLVAEALSMRPDECCGVLGGREGRAERLCAIPNAAPSPRVRFELAPAHLWDARRRLRREGLDIVGFYHSHPRTSPVPSPYDVERAYYPDAVYVIVGVEPRPCVRAFRIARGRVDEVTVTIVECRQDD